MVCLLVSPRGATSPVKTPRAPVHGCVVRGGGGYPPAPPQLASCVPPPASCVRCVRHTTSCVRICCPHLKHFFNNINIFIYVIDLDPFFGPLAL